AAIVVDAKDGERLSRVAVYEMRPRPMVAGNLFKKRNDLLKAFERLRARDEATLGTNEKRKDAEARRAGGDDAIVTGLAFQRSTGVRMRAVPVVAEACFLKHGEEFVVGHRVRGSTNAVRRR